MKRFLKTIGFLFIMMILLLGGLIAYFVFDIGRWPSTKEEKIFMSRLNEAIEAGRTEIPLKELTDFEWDSVCVFTPYSAPETHVKYITQEYSIKGNIPDLNDDSKWALLFKINQNRTAQFIQVPVHISQNWKPKVCYSKQAIVISEQKKSKLDQKEYQFIYIND